MCVTDVGVAVTDLRVGAKSSRAFQLSRSQVELRTAILIFLEIVKAAAAGLDTLCCRLCEGCHCGRLPSHWQRARTQEYLACETRFFTYMSQHAESKAALSGLAWVASQCRGLLTPPHSSLKSWERTGRELTTFILYII